MTSPQDTYTHGHHDSVLRSHRWRTVDNSAAYLRDHLVAGRSLLDVGCGPGSLSIDLARRVAPGRVLAVDRAADVLVEARRAAADAEVDNVSFRTADAYALDARDDTFDIVHAHQLLQHVSDPVAMLREMRRVCRAGGVVAVREVDFGAATRYPDDPVLDRFTAAYRTVARGNGGEPDAGRRLVAWARAAGFDEVAASASVWCFASADERAWWSDLWADRVRHSTLAEQMVVRGLATADDLEEMSAAWRRWGADDDAWSAIVHGEITATA